MNVMNININPDRMFSGSLFFLSNMYPCPVKIQVNGKEYLFQSSEAAFQAGKCRNPEDVGLFTRVRDGAAAKRLGRKVDKRDDWDAYRIVWMRRVVFSKFTQNPKLMEQLLGTYPLPLKETNTWKDTFWGVCDGRGENHLGKILMELRETKLPYQRTKGELDILGFQ